MTIDQTNTKDLIESLLTNPQAFANNGKAHVLLQRYLDGEDVTSLKPLLLSSEQLVQEEALWILSELGVKGTSLMQEALILYESAPIWQMRAAALEIIAVCSTGECLDKYTHVILALESPQSMCRCIAMSLVARSHEDKLRCAMTLLEDAEENKALHCQGLDLLLRSRQFNPDQMLMLLRTTDSLSRKYAAIAIWREGERMLEVFNRLPQFSDPDLTEFHRWESSLGHPSCRHLYPT